MYIYLLTIFNSLPLLSDGRKDAYCREPQYRGRTTTAEISFFIVNKYLLNFDCKITAFFFIQQIFNRLIAQINENALLPFYQRCSDAYQQDTQDDIE